MSITYRKIQDLQKIQSCAGKLESILGENECGGKDDRGIRNNGEDNANKKYNGKNR